MATKQQVDILLNIRENFAGLNRFASGVQSRMRSVDQFVKRIEGSAQQVNNLLGGAAAFIGGQQLVGFFGNAIRKGVEFNAKMEQAAFAIAAVLRNADNSGRFQNFENALSEAGKVLDTLRAKAESTGTAFQPLLEAYQGTAALMARENFTIKQQVDTIFGVVQAVRSLGLPDFQNIQELRSILTGAITPRSSTLATVLNISNEDVAAAREQGRLFEFLSDKLAANIEAAEKSSGVLDRLRTQFESLFTQRMAARIENVNTSLEGLYKRLIDLTSAPIFGTLFATIGDKIAGVVDALASVVEWLNRLGPVGQSALSGIITQAGTLLVLLGSLAAGGLVLRGVIAGLRLVLQPVRALFFAIAGTSLVALIGDIQLLSRSLGLLSTLRLANASQRAGVLSLAAAVAVLSYQFGRFLGNLRSGEDGLSLIDRLSIQILRVPGELAIAEAGARRFWEALTGDKEAAIERYNRRIAEIRAEQEQAFQYIRATSASDDQDPVAAVKRQFEQEQRLRETKAQQEAREKYESKRLEFDIETQIAEARLRGDQAEVEALQRGRAAARLQKELVGDANLENQQKLEALGLIQARLDAEEGLRDQVRQRQDEERQLATQLAQIERRRTLIENDRLATQEERAERSVVLMREENELILNRIRLLETNLETGVDEQTERQLRDRIDQLQKQATRNVGQIENTRPLSVREQIGADLANFASEFGTKAEQIAAIFSGPIKAAISGVRDVFSDLLGDTEYWTQRLGSVPGRIIGSITGAISNLFAGWIAGRIKAAVVDKLMTAQSVAAAAGAATATAALWSPAATLATIATFGAAALGAPAQIAGSMAATRGVASAFALATPLALGGLVTGPGGPMDDKILAALSNGEYVVRASAVDTVGEAFMDQLNAGIVNLGALPERLAGGIAKPTSTSPTARSVSQSGHFDDRERKLIVQVAMINAEADKREFMEREGVKVVYDFLSKRSKMLNT